MTRRPAGTRMRTRHDGRRERCEPDSEDVEVVAAPERYLMYRLVWQGGEAVCQDMAERVFWAHHPQSAA